MRRIFNLRVGGNYLFRECSGRAILFTFTVAEVQLDTRKEKSLFNRATYLTMHYNLKLISYPIQNIERWNSLVSKHDQSLNANKLVWWQSYSGAVWNLKHWY